MAFRLPDANGPLCLAVETSVQQVAHRLVLPQLSPELFSMSDLIYSEKTPYFVTGYESINHLSEKEGNGELSLLLLQTLFLCKTLAPNTRATVVYVDAYPGDHIPYLSEMFPEVHFRLYDQRFEGSQKVIGTERITVNARPFSEFEAKQIAKEFGTLTDTSPSRTGNSTLPVKGQLYYVSQLRNVKYNSDVSTSESNAAIIDEDMQNQLLWAQTMKPVWSLIRYRAKLEKERIPETGETDLRPGHDSDVRNRPFRSIALRSLTDDCDTPAKRSLYYNYPLGYFLRVPMPKRNPKDMYLLTCASQTNGYTRMKAYYHEDIISLVTHQNEYVRRVMLYLNPYTNIFQGIYGLNIVRNYISEENVKIRERNLNARAKSEQESPEIDMGKAERYICGAGWDHRAMFYIMTLYERWRELGNPEVPDVDKKAIKRILRIFIEMELKGAALASTSRKQEDQ